MSKYKGKHGGEKGQKIWEGPPPFWAMPERKHFIEVRPPCLSFFKEYLRPNLRCPPRWSQQGQSWDPPEKSRFWYCPWSLCFSQHWKIAISIHIYIATEDRAIQCVPVEPTARALMAGSRGEGCGGKPWGVGGARGVWTHRAWVAQLVQVVHLRLWKKINFLNKEAAYYRFRHLWKWSLLQWILARHNTWVKTVNIVHLKQCIINVS